jgi:hypothetical protein
VPRSSGCATIGKRETERRPRRPDAELSAGGARLSSINTYTYSAHNQNPSTNLHISTPHALIDQAQEVKALELMPVIPNGENMG